MYYMVAPTGRTVYFLADPVEDEPNHTWDDYRSNYQKTVAASLLFPQVHHFEVMPWPDRVFTYKYPAGSYSAEDKITIPESYAAELLTVVNALNEMKQTDVKWESGNQDVGVMVSDTMMFQRGNSWGENGPIQFNAFYGIALPLVKAGVPVKCLVLERCLDPKTLEQVKLLYLSYEAMKPLKPEYHDRLSEWVRSGGRLVYVGDDSDPFHTARDWWNADGRTSGTAREHLFSKLDAPINAREIKTWTVGKGQVTWHPQHPAELAMDPIGPETVSSLATINKIGSDLTLNASPHIRLQRGPYVVGAVIHESSIERPMELKGEWLDLFSSGTMEVTNPVTQPGNVFLFRSLNEPHLKDQPEIIATTARAVHTTVSASEINYQLKSSSSVKQHQILLRAKAKPTKVEVNGVVTSDWTWIEKTQLLRVRMPWRNDGIRLTLTK